MNREKLDIATFNQFGANPNNLNNLDFVLTTWNGEPIHRLDPTSQKEMKMELEKLQTKYYKDNTKIKDTGQMYLTIAPRQSWK